MPIPLGRGWRDSPLSPQRGHTAPSTAAWVLPKRCCKHKRSGNRSGNEHKLLGLSGGWE